MKRVLLAIVFVICFSEVARAETWGFVGESAEKVKSNSTASTIESREVMFCDIGNILFNKPYILVWVKVFYIDDHLYNLLQYKAGGVPLLYDIDSYKQVTGHMLLYKINCRDRTYLYIDSPLKLREEPVYFIRKGIMMDLLYEIVCPLVETRK